MVERWQEAKAAPDWQRQVRDWQELFENFAQQYIEEAGPSARLEEALRYALFAPGKRVRPVLVYAAAHAVQPEMPQSHYRCLNCLAAALECIHAYSLVHDDLPCMDNDDLRRGRPCCHIVYGEATALLVGDALQAEAMDLLIEACNGNPQGLHAAKAVADAAGRLGMVGGQQLDLEGESRRLDLEELERMVQGKTGALIRAALVAGAIAGQGYDETSVSLFSQLGTELGRAFQIRDDLLDVEADPALLGKTLGKDAAAGKSTYVSLLGLEGARAEAEASERAVAEALDGLEKLGYDLAFLRAYTEYLATRRS